MKCIVNFSKRWTLRWSTLMKRIKRSKVLPLCNEVGKEIPCSFRVVWVRTQTWVAWDPWSKSFLALHSPKTCCRNLLFSCWAVTCAEWRWKRETGVHRHSKRLNLKCQIKPSKPLFSSIPISLKQKIMSSKMRITTGQKKERRLARHGCLVRQ